MKKIFNIFFEHDGNPDYVKSFDGLRGIAALSVILSHCSKCGYHLFDINLLKSGKFGIYLFFVLSAYLLDRQICSALLADKADAGFWKSYFRKRFLRIYPMYLVALLLYGALTFIGFDTLINEIQDIPLHLLLVKGESVFWSIPVELKYYAISPLILIICRKYLKWNFTLISIFISVLIIITMSCHYFFTLPVVSTLGYLPVFLVGTLLAVFELLKKDIFENKSWVRLMDIGALVGLLIMLLTIPSVFNFLTGGAYDINFRRPLFSVPYSLLWAVILMSSKYGRGVAKWFFELKFFRFFGVISYSVYLLHVPVLMFLTSNESIPLGAKVYVFLIAISIIGSITYLCIERPFLKMKFKVKAKNEK
jgi:peptidoglycan/LPS O-acetylase OafA/YrhL